jgi:tRNA pseudouridine38-40 synthase
MTERNIKLVLEYDGTDFCGWQIQPQVRTVQGVLEAALTGLLQHFVRVTVAGRTDTGVHAMGQVANFVTTSHLPISTLLRGGNALLPRDVRIVDCEQVATEFHSRFSAKARSYQYRICQYPRAVGRQYAWHVYHHVSIESMQEACFFLLGENDFTSFCQATSQLDHHRCFVHSANWCKDEKDLIFEITANRFVHNMIRILVGTFIEIGRGKWSPQEMQSILQGMDRRLAGPTAPAKGLTFMQVTY